MKLGECKKSSVKQLFLKVSIWVGVVLIGIYVVLPAIFISLGNICPTYFSSDGALVTLTNGLNALVGYCSLAVGVVSIIYAYLSNQRVDEQQKRNEEFIKDLSNKIDELQKSNIKLFDQVVTAQQNNTKQDSSK